MALSRILLRFTGFLTLAATTSVAQESYKKCFACGSAKDEVGHPRGIISIPSDLQGSLGNLETITCFQFNQAGMGGLLPEPICELNRLASFRTTCECPGGGGIVLESQVETTPMPTGTILDTGGPSHVPKQRPSHSPSAVPHVIAAHAPIVPMMPAQAALGSASKKSKSRSTLVTSKSQKSTKKDSKSAGTESEQKSRQPMSTVHSEKEKKSKKQRTEKKVTTKLVH